ncbi:MAG: nitroreductase/quinone reductase family protein [Terracoccus sp.]
MGKSYRVGQGQRATNAVFKKLAQVGLGARYLHVLTVTGRTSGVQRSVPVDVMDIGGERYLVAPYGEVNWVRNLRVANEATLRRGRQVQLYGAVEITPDRAVTVIREYVRSVPVTKAYWDIDAHSCDEDVLREAAGHPVFQLVSASGPTAT